jgi:hypothetical protein
MYGAAQDAALERQIGCGRHAFTIKHASRRSRIAGLQPGIRDE